MTTSPDTRYRGILFILSGPSGVGKDTVLNQALPALGNIRTSISVTTRAPRNQEQHGVDYFFVSTEEFSAMLERGEMLEHAGVHGHFYGTPRQWVLDELTAGRDVVLEIDVQGAALVKQDITDAVLVFLAPPSWQELSQRLRGRQTEDESTMLRRLANAKSELSKAHTYDYVIINDALPDAVARLQAVVTAERLRPWRQDLPALLTEEDSDG